MPRRGRPDDDPSLRANRRVERDVQVSLGFLIAGAGIVLVLLVTGPLGELFGNPSDFASSLPRWELFVMAAFFLLMGAVFTAVNGWCYDACGIARRSDVLPRGARR